MEELDWGRRSSVDREGVVAEESLVGEGSAARQQQQESSDKEGERGSAAGVSVCVWCGQCEDKRERGFG